VVATLKTAFFNLRLHGLVKDVKNFVLVENIVSDFQKLLLLGVCLPLLYSLNGALLRVGYLNQPFNKSNDLAYNNVSCYFIVESIGLFDD
jgi:hypothetical protein